VIPVPIIEAVHIENDGLVLVWFRADLSTPYAEYRMIDSDPTRLEPAE
jgi:hypothetical protein